MSTKKLASHQRSLYQAYNLHILMECQLYGQKPQLDQKSQSNSCTINADQNKILKLFKLTHLVDKT